MRKSTRIRRSKTTKHTRTRKHNRKHTRKHNRKHRGGGDKETIAQLTAQITQLQNINDILTIKDKLCEQRYHEVPTKQLLDYFNEQAFNLKQGHVTNVDYAKTDLDYVRQELVSRNVPLVEDDPTLKPTRISVSPSPPTSRFAVSPSPPTSRFSVSPVPAPISRFLVSSAKMGGIKSTWDEEKQRKKRDSEEEFQDEIKENESTSARWAREDMAKFREDEIRENESTSARWAREDMAKFQLEEREKIKREAMSRNE